MKLQGRKLLKRSPSFDEQINSTNDRNNITDSENNISNNMVRILDDDVKAGVINDVIDQKYLFITFQFFFFFNWRLSNYYK